MLKFSFPLVLLLGMLSVPHTGRSESLLQSKDRIVFVGDSITGQGGKGDAGWVALIGKALKAQNSENNQTMVALGGSGQSVGSWANVEKKSRTEPVFLDIKEYDVKKELDQHADVVVIMLGMNDALSTGLRDEPESYRKWVEAYRGLITSIRSRATPRVLALGTPTPCTEDPDSPKNRVMDKMARELEKLAAEEKCVVLPTRATAWEVLKKGRQLKPDFHITGDMVHPNPGGHIAIAAGMLRGLGEGAAATALLQNPSAGYVAPGSKKGLSYEFGLAENKVPSADLHFWIRAYSGAKVEIELPQGWKVEDTKQDGEQTQFSVTGAPDKLINSVVLRSGGETAEVKIPAAWLVGTGNLGWLGWNQGVYNAETGRIPSDTIIRTGQGFAEAMAGMELKAGVPVVWKYYISGVSDGTFGAPGAIDFARVSYFNGGEVGYGLRWVQSAKERPVIVKIAKLGFAGIPHLEAWPIAPVRIPA